MDMIGHHDECVQFVAAFAAVMVERFEKKPGIVFDLEKPSILPGPKSYEISSGRRKES
jgi:hypothetical protein